jgi:tetratricopeptide (TPR) repeat protein
MKALILILLLISEVSLAAIVDNKINPVAYFVSRDTERDKISENLNLHKKVTLVGVTGIGKTEITRKYANTKQNMYKLIWFFDSFIDLNEQFVMLAKNINVQFANEIKHKLSEDPDTAQRDVKNFLAPREDWLLIFDNLKLTDNQKLLDIVYWSHNGHIIICSQNAEKLPNVIYVHELSDNDSLILLENIIGEDSKKESMKDIVKLFKGYPALVVQSAFFIKENQYLSLEEYQKMLSSVSDPILGHVKWARDILSKDESQLLNQLSLINNQRFSKQLLKIIADDPVKVGDLLHKISRLGLIRYVQGKNDQSTFEMHDVIVTAITSLNDKNTNIENLNNIIDRLNNKIPENIVDKYKLFQEDPTLLGNLEIILENSHKYSISLKQIITLRSNMMDYYMTHLDYYNCEKMKVWLVKEEKNLRLNEMNEKQKSHYANYYLNIGIYEDFAKADFTESLRYFDKADEVMKGVAGSQSIKFYILAQKAQTYIWGGDIKQAEDNLSKAQAILTQYKDLDFDLGIYWFLKAKIALFKADYKEALLCIQSAIKVEMHLEPDSATVPNYILQSEILNAMGKYSEAYKIIKKSHYQEIGDKIPDHEFQARLLIPMANAEANVGMLDMAIKHIDQACNIFEAEVAKYNLPMIVNTDYASALVIKGDILAKQNKLDESIKTYNVAESIYLNRYINNFGTTDDIAYLFAQASKVACQLKSDFWIEHFKDRLIGYFGESNPHSQEAIKYCNSLK